MTIYDVKVRFERKVVPKEYEHGIGEVQFSATGEFATLAEANSQALDLMAAAKAAVLASLGKALTKEAASAAAVISPDKAETTAAPAANKGGRPAGSKNKVKEETKAAPVATDDFGEGEAAPAVTTDSEFADAPDEFAEAAAVAEAPKAMEPKELQSWISGHIQAKRIPAEKVREIMKLFKVARTDDTTPEMRPKIVKAIEDAIKGAAKK